MEAGNALEMHGTSSSLTRDHYNNVSSQTQKQRAGGVLYSMKLVHNGWKRELLQQYGFGCDTLLDIGCGRGGDIQKWNDCHIRHAHGVDNSFRELHEAIRRASSYTKKKTDGGVMTVCTFQLHDFLKPYTPLLSYSLVTTFFCLHYFCVSASSCKTLLETISKALRRGGYWVGICLDSNKVTRWIKEGKQSPYLRIQNVSVGNHSLSMEGFGQAYSYDLVDTVTSSFRGDGGSLEYLVPMPEVVRYAQMFGLECMFVKPCVIPGFEYPGVEASEMCIQFCFKSIF